VNKVFAVTTIVIGVVGALIRAQGAGYEQSAKEFADVNIADPTTVVPEDLEDLARGFRTSVIATVKDVEGVRTAALAPTSKPGMPGPVGAFIGYRIHVEEVLYDRYVRREALQAGDIIVVDDMVGMPGLKRFRSGEVTLKPGDQCLLSLAYRPDRSWLLAPWPNQFRRVTTVAGVDARPIRPGLEAALRSVGAMTVEGSRERLDWHRLVGAFRSADPALHGGR